MDAQQLVLIGLGANLGKRIETITHACQQINEYIGPTIAQSKLYETKALVWPGSIEQQPNFINAAIAVSSNVSPEKILSYLLDIETKAGRIRAHDGSRWTARALDLDLLGVGSLILTTERLTLPHPGIAHRDFVLAPLIDVAPEWEHPLLRLSVQELYDRFLASGQERFVLRSLDV